MSVWLRLAAGVGRHRGAPGAAQRAQHTLTHTDEHGQAVMVDVGGKVSTQREATACGRIVVGDVVMRLIRDNLIKKGDVLTVAKLAGIMGAKHYASSCCRFRNKWSMCIVARYMTPEVLLKNHCESSLNNPERTALTNLLSTRLISNENNPCVLPYLSFASDSQSGVFSLS
jgi:hypothetical protein